MHQESSLAKINLNLKILGKRSDGFHEIETTMLPISLSDTLTFHPHLNYQLTSNQNDIPLDETNLITKATRLFEQTTKLTCNWKITLEKHIPHGAGLGGGSSNAAATLRALNTLHKTNLSNEQLTTLAAELGSDVPFFITQQPALCKGRGERITPITLTHQPKLLILKPNFPVFTPQAYDQWQHSKEIHTINYATQHTPYGELFNDLERPVFAKHRFLAELKMWLLEQPEVDAALMSGSGSTIFAILNNTQTDLQQRAKHTLDPTLTTFQITS